MPLLLAGLGLLVAVRVGYNLIEGPVNDVGFAGVVGADSILHGWPLYTGDDNHLDTYGPVNYLAYVPASIVFPMAQGWARDGLAAAHATSIAVDMLTLGMLVLAGACAGATPARTWGWPSPSCTPPARGRSWAWRSVPTTA